MQTWLAKLSHEGEVTLNIRAHPGAHTTKIKGVMADGTLRIDVAAVPEDGKANAALIDFLAEQIGVPRSWISIPIGEAHRRKIVRIVRSTPLFNP
jgi:uncharacterized protein YggU (UPF0235/DUF167 family)